MLLVEATSTGLQAWIRDNIVPLLLLVTAVSLFALAHRGENAKSMKVLTGVVVALLVLGLAGGGKADDLGAWLAGLITG